MFATNSFELSRGVLFVSGLALAPDGDHARVAFEAEDGVDFSVQYPLASVNAGKVYWYWPGSDNAAFRLAINLSGTRHSGDKFLFRVRYADRAEVPLEDIRTTFAVPKNIEVLQNYPTGEALSRVQRFDTVSGVAVKGLSDALRILRIAKHYGYQDGGTALDWGVGHGRVARHLPALGIDDIYGVDIDPLNIQWAQEHLPGINFRVGPLMPPTDFTPESFNLIYGISVMTHLTREVQVAWLQEIARLLKPNGLALLTFTGDSSVAFASRYLDRAWLDEYLENGSGRDLPDRSLVGVIEDSDYYKNVKASAPTVAKLCQEYLDVAGVHECMFGYQDLLVLRK